MVTISNKVDKPKKTAAELISMLKNEKGISFHYMRETDAEVYLIEKNNYLRTASYRKNYEKGTKGLYNDKYIHLDFAYLVELSIIDMHLRFLLLQMCIDIEHALKVHLLSLLESNTTEDGYQVVSDFLNKNIQVINSIEHKVDSVFTGDLIDKYFNIVYVFDKTNKRVKTRIISIDCPVWVLVEIISFGDLLKFYSYVSNRIGYHEFDVNVLNPIKSLRNACAHNNCLLNNLKKGSTHPPPVISGLIANIPSIGKEERTNKLSCRPLFEIVCLLYFYPNIVSEKVKKHRLSELKELIYKRMPEKSGYFKLNPLITTSYEFLKKVVDNIG